MTTGEVAPVDTDLVPNYADVTEGIKDQEYNTLDGQAYGVPHGRGPNFLMYRTDEVPQAPTSWAVIWDDAEPATRERSRSTTTRSSSPTRRSTSRPRSPISGSPTRTSWTRSSSTLPSSC